MNNSVLTISPISQASDSSQFLLNNSNNHYMISPSMTPGQPSMTPGQPSMTPGQPSMTPGQPSMTPGQPSMTPGQPSMTPGQPSITPGQPFMTPGQPFMTPGQPFMTQEPKMTNGINSQTQEPVMTNESKMTQGINSVTQEPKKDPINQSTLTYEGDNIFISNKRCDDGKYIYSVFHIMMSIVAIYLSVRCNESINYLSLFIAFCFPYPYIIYSLISNKGICTSI